MLGDVFEYMFEVQVLDYFVVGGVSVIDVFLDGYIFDVSFVLILLVDEYGVLFLGVFDVVNYVVDVDKMFVFGVLNIGLMMFIFDLLSELILCGVDVLLFGGCVLVFGIGGLVFDCLMIDFGVIIVMFVFCVVILESFFDDYFLGDFFVDQGDCLSNIVVVDLMFYFVVDFLVIVVMEFDDMLVLVNIVFGQVMKLIYVINGNFGFLQFVEISFGDEIIYWFEVVMFLVDFENFVVSDFLFFLVFVVIEVMSLLVFVDFVVFVVGIFKFGLIDILFVLVGVFSFSMQVFVNSVVLDFGDFDVLSSVVMKIDVFFIVMVSDELFVDDLLFMNQFYFEQVSINGGVYVVDVIVQFCLWQLLLCFSKGVVSFDNGVVIFVFVDVGLLFVGLVILNDLVVLFIGLDVLGVDVGDIVIFVLVFENFGGSGVFDVVFDDVLLLGFVVLLGGFNLLVWCGDGMVLSVSLMGLNFNDEDFFGNGFEIVDLSGEVVCQEYVLVIGFNFVFVIYEFEVVLVIVVLVLIYVNDVGLMQYGGDDGFGVSVNYVFGLMQFCDLVIVIVVLLLIMKFIMVMSELYIGEIDLGCLLVIGEVVSYCVVVCVLEGMLLGVILVDQVMFGLWIESIDLIMVIVGFLMLYGGGFLGVCIDVVIDGNGCVVMLFFDDIINVNCVNGIDDMIMIDYIVCVFDDVNVMLGVVVVNIVFWFWIGGQIGVFVLQVFIVEFVFDFDKLVMLGNGDVGDMVLFMLMVLYFGVLMVVVFDFLLIDVFIDFDLVLVNGLVVVVGGMVVCGNGGEGDFEVCFDSLVFGVIVIVIFDVLLFNLVFVGDVLMNFVQFFWDSFLGEVGECNYGLSFVGV